MKAILKTLPILTLLAGAAGSAVACEPWRDDWMGRDKAAHFGASFAFGVAGSRLTREPWEAVGLALIVAGDVLVGGASLLRAFDGGEV